MAIVEKVKELAELEQEMLANEPCFAELKEFYERMKREGIAIKKEYELPPLDTIGRSIYSTRAPKTRS